MSKIKSLAFKGFSLQSIKFLQALSINNSKVWFEKHREEYLSYILAPLQSLIREIGPSLLDIDKELEITPAVNKTISRIYRDTRFSKDKSPYKSNVWATFKIRQSNNWQTLPTYFFEFSVSGYKYGMGFYKALPSVMTSLRASITEDPKSFLKAIKFYERENEFELGGEEYKRDFNPALDEKIKVWYQKKNLYLIAKRDIDDDFLSSQLITKLSKSFKSLAPIYKYLKKMATR